MVDRGCFYQTTMAVLLLSVVGALAQPGVPANGGMGSVPPGNYNVSLRSDADKALPNPYARDETFFKLPPDRVLGAASAIDIDKDGKSIWVADRCGRYKPGQDVCIGSPYDPVMKFDHTGKLVKSFGRGVIVYPHGLYVDPQGNVWVVDVQSNLQRPATKISGPPLVAPPGTPPNGDQVVKFSPDGKVLLRLGTPGVYGNDDHHFAQPSDVVTAPNGDIFVADGHDSAPSNNRIVKFDKDGRFIKAWGTPGSGPEQFDCPHGLAMDSQGRLFVADRGNARIQIYDQDGHLLDSWKQFGMPSGIYIDKNDVLYAADTESSVLQGNAFVRGIHVGSARTGQVTAFIPDPLGNPAPWEPLRLTTGAEGVAADADGTIYAAQVTPVGLVRYTRK
jgi:sugar lactone lactonase YvrE